MAALHIDTPLLESRALSERSRRSVWLKMEALQPPGSFKIRGIGLKCQAAASAGAARFISSSGGNAGIAAAYAGRQLSLPVLVVVPQTTSERAQALIRLQGAEVIVHGASWQEANALAQSLVAPGDAFVHPFDDPLIWRGHATIVDEVARTALKPDVVVVSVGGGGLLCGVIEGLHRNGWADVPVVAVETLGADSYAQSVAAGRRIELPAITSIASSLGARQVCAQALAWTKQHPVHTVVVTDREAIAACESFIDDQRVVVEPACGAALAVLYGDLEVMRSYRRPLVIVCGGVTATLAQLRRWAADGA
jgi:L-serine/L-threonine ammonia-lyase